jgi:hypothetical protein
MAKTRKSNPETAEVNKTMRVIAESILGNRDAIAKEVAQSILDREPAYAKGEPIAHGELIDAVLANMEEIFFPIAGKPQEGVVFEETGRRRAEQNIPLQAVLHAYRIGSQLEWERFVDFARDAPHSEQVIIQGTSRFWQIGDTAATQVAHAYIDAVGDRKRDNVEERNALIDMLLQGNLSNGSDLWDTAETLQLPVRGTFLVVVGVQKEPGELARSKASRTIQAAHGVALWRSQGEVEIGLLSLARVPSADTTLRLLDDAATGPTGVSELFHDLQEVPQFLRQARIACEASRGNPVGATSYASIPLQAMFALSPGAAEDVRRCVFGDLLKLPHNERQELLDTVLAFARAEGSVSECANAIFLHRNSVYRRLQRIHELTGRDPQSPIGMAELYAAIEADRILSHQGDLTR